jgi:hypothetical protein
MGWHPGSPGERAREMKAVESGCGGELRQGDVAEKMLGQVFHCTPDGMLVSELPRGPSPRSRVAREEPVESRQKQLFPFESRRWTTEDRMCAVEPRCQNRIIDDYVEGMAVAAASCEER